MGGGGVTMPAGRWSRLYVVKTFDGWVIREILDDEPMHKTHRVPEGMTPGQMIDAMIVTHMLDTKAG